MLHIPEPRILSGIVGMIFCSAVAAQKADKSSELPDFVKSGIESLKAEIEAVIKDPQGAVAIRDKSDYFSTISSALPESQLLELLGRRLNRNPVIDSYVKWQLLSLQKTPFSQENVPEAFKLYRSTMVAPVRLGVGNDREMQMLLKQVNKENLSQVNTSWLSQRTAHDRLAAPFWAYRDELYRKLPKTFEIVRAGFEDAEQRMQRGYYSKSFVDQLILDLRGLAAGAKPVEINQLAQFARYYAGREGVLVYDQIQEDKGKVKWKTLRFRFDKNKMNELASDLEETAKLSF